MKVVLVTFFLILFSFTVWALPFHVVLLKAPPHLSFEAQGLSVKNEFGSSLYFLSWQKNLSFPFVLKIIGSEGGFIEKKVFSLNDIKNLRIPIGIIKNKNPNPPSLSSLPLPCPRVEKKEDGSSFYKTLEDILNKTPTAQLLDPDFLEGIQYKSYSHFDEKNVLAITKVILRYDYENNRIIDYEGPSFKTGKKQVIYEGEGGFYANLHYAVVPYYKGIPRMDRQTLLHLAQGKLSEIDKDNLKPELRTHSFIPGPFLAKQDYIYQQCEWGDTTYQAPVQELQYDHLFIWDWDLPTKKKEHVLIIVWEGDEEDWFIQDQMIHPFYLTDDLIAVFEVNRAETLKPLTLINLDQTLEITVLTRQ